ncbi:MAG TPA: hypothetical protein IAD49_02870 [Candidatus Fimihabitans intestinipullorum]|uniref:ABC-2 family transporter protein n=1 Tax=Candidatus Fimihabitans intestinipullorum TaxID=2840820 RepID=A0A9D1L3E1_9BACT|nr:hypothetical protein [Candidatus Fimihabitans intestinipullorum]
MINIIKSDLYRVFRGKAIYVAIIIILLLAVVSCFSMSPGHIGITSSSDAQPLVKDEELLEKVYETNSILETRELMKEYGAYPLDKSQLGANANLYYFFIIVVVIVLVTDLSNSTAKNTLSSAISRKKYYLSKLITCIGLGTFLVLINNYGSYMINLIMNGKEFSAGILEITKLTILQLPILYGIISMLVCIGFCFRKTGTFNSITIPLIIVIQLIIMGIATLFHLDANNILNYEFQYMIGNLISNPSNAYILKTLVLAIFYIVIFNVIGYRVFRKTEIK